MKRVLSFCVVMLLLISTFAVSVSAADSDQYGRGANIYIDTEKGCTSIATNSTFYRYMDIVKIGGFSQASNGVFLHNAVSEIRSIKGNSLPYPYFESSKTENGLTIKDNGDGSLTLNGTVTDTVYFQLTSPGAVVGYMSGAYYGVIGSSDVGFCTEGSKSNVFYTPDDPILGASYNDYMKLQFNAGSTFDNVTIYPTISRLKFTSDSEPLLPYSKVSYYIPSEVMALPGYGYGINSSFYNYLEFTPAGAVYYHEVVGEREYKTGDDSLENVKTNGVTTLYVLDKENVTEVTRYFDWYGVIEVFENSYVWVISSNKGGNMLKYVAYFSDFTEPCTTSHYFGTEYTCLFCGAHVPPPFHVLIMQNIIGGIGIGSNVATGFSDLFDGMMISNGKLTTIASMAFAFAGLALIIVIFYAISHKFKK